MADQFPVVYADRVINDMGYHLFVFDCERCGKKHTHGASEGYRAPHCDKWPDGGYILKERQ